MELVMRLLWGRRARMTSQPAKPAAASATPPITQGQRYRASAGWLSVTAPTVLKGATAGRLERLAAAAREAAATGAGEEVFCSVAAGLGNEFTVGGAKPWGAEPGARETVAFDGKAITSVSFVGGEFVGGAFVATALAEASLFKAARLVPTLVPTMISDGTGTAGCRTTGGGAGMAAGIAGASGGGAAAGGGTGLGGGGNSGKLSVSDRFTEHPKYRP